MLLYENWNVNEASQTLVPLILRKLREFTELDQKQN